MSSTLAAWAVLFVSKGWESTTGDAIQRRLTLLVLGLLVGAAAWGLAEFLMVQPPWLVDINWAGTENAPNALYDNLNNPLMWGYVAFFGCLMGAVRWWRQADPLRSTEPGLWRTAACVLGALVVQVFIPFPSGFLIAVTMAEQSRLPHHSWIAKNVS